MKQNKPKTKSIKISAKQYSAIAAIAKQDMRTISTALSIAIEDYLISRREGDGLREVAEP